MTEARGYTTEQERFWAGEFGDHYVRRNRDAALVTANVALFRRILETTGPLESILELGANIGLNLKALHELLPEVRLAGVEINREAWSELSAMPFVEAHHASILDFEADGRFDLVFTKGVLIHMAPERLEQVYATMIESSRRYVCLAEYYNPTPVEVPYRGHERRLFKRDFAGEILERWPVELVDYGFVYRRDPHHPQDDLTWFLLEKR
ncbi:MAG TPA: pseudaminic acid biosynthesis-associated methylase [Thermoanaerobaculia bacterium]|nr:pseudaminic acid biosynthesis-associated methylase [Thermoanaerobaculia bacterium]